MLVIAAAAQGGTSFFCLCTPAFPCMPRPGVSLLSLLTGPGQAQGKRQILCLGKLHRVDSLDPLRA